MEKMEMPEDKGCVCKGALRGLIKEYEDLKGSCYIDSGGRVYTFQGILYSDDYYYYMVNTHTSAVVLLSCVLDIEVYGFTLKEGNDDK